jgi:hypothetical protein
MLISWRVILKEEDIFGDSPSIFCEALLERGFYPENVPPVFAVRNFYKLAASHISTEKYQSNKPTEPVVYSSSKRGGSRRVFSVPNPLFYLDCAIFFSKYRSEIYEHYVATGDSISIPNFSKSERPARIKSHSEFHRTRRYLFATSRYIVRTDISRYFHSIYTHSIPWAINGKTEAKRDRKSESETVFGNRLDYITRQAQDGQTVGIPVGPDFSRYTSELIGKAIDKKFRESHGDQPLYLRHVDDIYIGADDLDQANDLLSGIREAIRSLQLDINESKTDIIETRYDLEPYWPVRLRREIENFTKKSPKDDNGQVGADFVYFLDEVFRVANVESDDGVVRYVIKKFDDAKLLNSYWEQIEPFLVRAVVSFPRSWDYVARIIAWRVAGKSQIDRDVWQKVVQKALHRSAAQGGDSEICWLLWLLKQLNLQLSEKTLSAIIERCGAMSVLLAIDVFKHSEHQYKFPNSTLLERLGSLPMQGPDWLLAYEADRQFGFKIKTKNTQGSALFSELYDSDVSFYQKDGKPNFINQVDGQLRESALEGVYSSYDDDETETSTDLSKLLSISKRFRDINVDKIANPQNAIETEQSDF